MKNASAIGSLVAIAIIVGCTASPNGVMPRQSAGVHPYILQGNTPSPSPWQRVPWPTSYRPVFVGPDASSMWLVDSLNAGGAQRLDLSTDQMLSIPINGSAIAGTAGPGGLVWFCGQNNFGSITKGGAVTYYQGLVTYCSGIVAGADGNLWVSDVGHVDRVTPTGVFTAFPLPSGVIAADQIASANNGFVWFSYFDSSNISQIGNVNVSTGQMAAYIVNARHGIISMNTGSDGNAYALTNRANKTAFIEVTPSGLVKWHFPAGLSFNNGAQDDQSNVGTIWLGGNIDGWNVKDHAVVPIGCCGNNPVLGPDMNVWFDGGVYLRRLLSVNPGSAYINAGSQKSFTITETDCPRCVWSAVSSDPSIASVSPISSGTFTVTGVVDGSTVITVSDKRYNSERVPITVN